MSTTAERSFTAVDARRKVAQRPRRSRLADYVADVLFIVILTTPFVIFTSPSSEPDAALSAPPAIAAPADAPAGQPE